MKLSLMMKREYIKSILISIIFFSVIFSIMFIRAYLGTEEAYRKGKFFFQKGEYIKAVTYFDRVIHWYIPFNKYIYQSAGYLWKIHLQAFNKGDLRLSLIALEAIRNGFYSSVSFYQPGKEWINKSDSEIMMIKESLGQDNSLGKKWLSSRSAIPIENRPEAPVLKWTLIFGLGLIGWIGAVIFYIFFIAEKIVRRPLMLLLTWLLITIVCYGLWFLGMMRA